GNYTLSPKYEYKDNRTEFKGYVGDLRYTAQSKGAKNINKFINDLLVLKDHIKSADTTLDISNISWGVSQSIQNKNT
ncbi:SIMPL domain-containing protein, partial [Aliarcobacter butzleri]